MSRTRVDWKSVDRANYVDFKKKHPTIKVDFNTWKEIIYMFNQYFAEYILETGEKGKLPFGFGEISIMKKKRTKIKTDPKTGREFINLPIDWKKTKEKGKVIYQMNYHTEGFFFGWHWFKKTTRLKHANLWYFKPCRLTSRLINHYIKVDPKYQHIYREYKD